MTLKIIRRREVEARTGLSRSTIYAGMGADSFPSSIRLGPRAVGWLESEIEQWLADQVAATRGNQVGSSASDAKPKVNPRRENDSASQQRRWSEAASAAASHVAQTGEELP